MTLLQAYKHAFRLFITPEQEWNLILAEENISYKKLLYQLLIPLIFLMSASNYIGLLLFEKNPSEHLQMFLYSAIATFIFSIVSIFLSSWLVKQFTVLPDNKERFNHAFILIGFSYTPGIIFNSIAFLFPTINYLTIFGLYSFFILYKGITPILNVPDHRKSGYFTFILIGLLSIYALLGAFFIGFANLMGF
ncbi:DUF1282 domain-containing protein [Marinifilum sp. N1E240]|uniref:Yip1 family protein n=1 Tax=Marinifilum sp. N1E240 TaxID=2608082 RepID=UPI00128B6E88|nr:Yip1 family protein [Marinifilum sp. N1E240]MPQ47556.1 DUF1282 domain-containing protein [Marinifilum sp. N1E240]